MRIAGRVSVILLSSMLGGCLATGQNASLPGTPVVDRTTIKITNPDLNKWVLRKAQPTPAGTPQGPSVWICRPMACAASTIVNVQMGQSPTRHPDRVALEKAAKLLPTEAKARDMLADAASEGDIRITSLSSKVTELRGYPAIVAESKQTTRGKAVFTVRGNIFAGAALVTLTASSYDRQEAKRSFDAFVAALEIIDIEPPQTPPAQPGNPADPVALDTPSAPVIPTRD